MGQNQDNFKRGTAELLVLHLLQKEDLYGYQITHAFEEKRRACNKNNRRNKVIMACELNNVKNGIRLEMLHNERIYKKTGT